MVSAIPESAFGKRSHSHNPLLFGLFARMHLVEQVGSGIRRIQDLMKSAGLPAPKCKDLRYHVIQFVGLEGLFS